MVKKEHHLGNLAACMKAKPQKGRMKNCGKNR